MREIPKGYEYFFKEYNEFCALCFFDTSDSGFNIISCFCAKETIDPCFTVSVNGNPSVPKFIFTQKKNLGDVIYNLNYFSVEVEPHMLNGKIKIEFLNESALPLVTFDDFPVDKKTNSFFQINNSIVFTEENSLIIEKLTPCLLKKRKRIFKQTRKSLIKSKDSLAVKGEFFRIIHKVMKPFFKKEIWLISDRMDKAGDNGEAFFEYVSKNTPKNVKPYFVLNKDSCDLKRIKKIGKVLHPLSFKYKLYYLFATRNIGSQLEYHVTTPIMAKNYLKDILQKQKTVFLQHGIIKDDLSPLYNRYDKNFHIFVTSTLPEYESIAKNVSYGYGERVKLTGLARFDKLENERKRIIFISPTWRMYNLKNTSTYELNDDFEKSAFFKFYNALLHSEKLISKAKENHYSLCFYPHFMMKNVISYFGKLDEVFINGDNFSYNDVFKQGSLLFTDYSSTQFDFAYLRKPVIYCHFDKNEFFKSHTYVEGYFDYTKHGFGEVCYNLDSAVNLLCDYMSKECEIKDEYLTRIEKTFKFYDKNNCLRILNEVLQLNGKNQ